MKHKFFYLAALAALALTAGCNRENEVSQTPDRVTGEDVKDRYKDAANATKAYAGQTRDEFLATTDQKIKELDARIDELGKKTEDLKDDARVEGEKAMASLREQRAAAAKKYDEMKSAGQDAWERTKVAFVTAWDEVEKAYENVKSKFSP